MYFCIDKLSVIYTYLSRALRSEIGAARKVRVVNSSFSPNVTDHKASSLEYNTYMLRQYLASVIECTVTLGLQSFDDMRTTNSIS
jgi:hypothetical protein